MLLELEYSTDLFDEERINQMVGDFQRLFEGWLPIRNNY